MSSMAISASNLQGGHAPGWHACPFPKDSGRLPIVFVMQLEADMHTDLFKTSIEFWDLEYNCFSL